MRKIIVILSALILISLLLVACAGEETETVEPDTAVPPVTEEATLEPTGIVEPDVTETAVIVLEGTPGESIPVTGEQDPSLMTNQLEYNVWNGDGEQIGEVDDLVVDFGNARVTYVVVGTGGFLDIGEEDVVVPWDVLRLETEEEDEFFGNGNGFVLLTEQERLENAPESDVNELLPGPGEAAAGWDNDIRNYWQESVVSETPEATGTPVGPADGSAEAIPLQGAILATELLDSGVDIGVSDEGEQNQEALVNTVVINNVVVDPMSGDIEYFVIDSTAFEIDDRFIPVPLNRFQWNPVVGAFDLDVEPATLEIAPFFASNQFLERSDEQWEAEFFEFWQ